MLNPLTLHGHLIVLRSLPQPTQAEQVALAEAVAKREAAIEKREAAVEKKEALLAKREVEVTKAKSMIKDADAGIITAMKNQAEKEKAVEEVRPSTTNLWLMTLLVLCLHDTSSTTTFIYKPPSWLHSFFFRPG